MKVIIVIVTILFVLSIISYKIGFKTGFNKTKKKIIEIRKSKIHNKGVFSNYKIKKGALIEIAPYIVVRDKKFINDYVFFYTKQKVYCLVLGSGSMFNHSKNYNVDFFVDSDNQNFEYYANRDIEKNEELFINYGEEYFKTRFINPK